MYEKYIMPRTAGSISEAQELIRPMANIPITNHNLGITGVITNKSIKKFGSEKAAKKSISPELHAIAVANADILYMNAEFKVTHNDYKNNIEVKQIYRLGSLMFDEKNGEYVPVMVTMKEFCDGSGNIIYSLEAIDINKKLDSAGHTSGLIGPLHSNGGNAIPITESNYIDKKLNSAGQSTTLSQTKPPASNDIQYVPIAEFNSKMRRLLKEVGGADSHLYY